MHFDLVDTVQRTTQIADTSLYRVEIDGIPFDDDLQCFGFFVNLEYRDADPIVTTRPGKGLRKFKRVRLVGFEHIKHESLNKNHILSPVSVQIYRAKYTLNHS